MDSFHNLDKGKYRKRITVLYWTLNLEVCIHVICWYNIGERSEPEKKIDNDKVNTTVGPLSYPSNLYTKPHLWQISGEGGGVRTPPPPPSGSALGQFCKVWGCMPQFKSFTEYLHPKFIVCDKEIYIYMYIILMNICSMHWNSSRDKLICSVDTPHWRRGRGVGPLISRNIFDFSSKSLNGNFRTQRPLQSFSALGPKAQLHYSDHMLSIVRDCFFFFRSAPINTNLVEDVEIFCFLWSFVEFRSAVSEKKLKMSRLIRGLGGHLIFQIGPEKTQNW